MPLNIKVDNPSAYAGAVLQYVPTQAELIEAIPEGQDVLRVLAVLAGLAAAGGVVWLSQPGKDFVLYAQDSVAEAKKVVWPTRKEATQMTVMVFVFVFVLALFMWLVDSGLSWLFYDILLKRG